MGVVYQARQTVMDRQVVIKVINKTLLDNPGALERFRREVKAAARLAHPNIVTAYDAEQAGDLHMLVMEFVPGQSLAEVLQKQGPLPVAQACHYALQAAKGLQHASEHGMVHRDVKPQNLMLTPKGQVKILDFGLAKLVSERRAGTGLTASGAYMGTPEYSAPEQATDARKADIRADLYSLGCTLYCLLAGRPPFREETTVLTILAHLQKEPPPLPALRPDVSPALWSVVARLLTKDPTRRYQTPAEVARALAPFCKGAGQAAVAVGVPSRSKAVPAEAPFVGLVTEPERRQPGKATPVAPRWRLAGVAGLLVVAVALATGLVGGWTVSRGDRATASRPAQDPPARPGKPAETSRATAAGAGPVLPQVYVRTVGHFVPVQVGPVLQVAIRQGDSFHVAVTADDKLLPFVQTIAGQDLRIFMDPGRGALQVTTPVKVTVTMPALEGVTLDAASRDGAIRGTVEGFRPVKEFRVRLTGNSDLEGEVRGDTVLIDAYGRNEMNVRGSGKNVRINIRPMGGDCHLRLVDFVAENATVDLAGPSRAEVQVRGHLDYCVYAPARLEYRGNPALGSHTANDPAAVSHVPP
jgi:hypothetical protein